MRRAAGAARDWDVFLIDLLARRESHPAKDAPGLDLLVGYALAERTAARPALEAVGPENEPGFEHFLTEAVLAVRPPPEGTGATLLDLARPLLSGLLHGLEEAAAGDLTDYAQLHQVRIAGKRLRYAMEVFADCFPPPFKGELYPRVEEVQEVLGRANDSHVAADRLAALRDRLRAGFAAEWKRWQPGVEGLLRFHQRRLPQERRRFLKWWEHWQKDGAPQLASLLAAPESSAVKKG
jgi:CHAD domain-containing protein